MKKIYIKNLSEKEKIKVLENNQKLKNEIFEIVYQDNMDYQLELGNIMLNHEKNKNNYDIKDYYTSFFLTITNGIKFLENINFKDVKDYISEKDLQEVNRIEKEYKKELYYYNKCNYYSDNFYKHEEKIENLAKKLLKIIENELHSLEDITDTDIQEYFLEDINDYWQGCYILNKKDFIMYEDISQVKNYK